MLHVFNLVTASRLMQALAQSDWGGDGDEECAILAARCLCSNYLSGMCTGNPHFTSKFPVLDRSIPTRGKLTCLVICGCSR